MIAKPVVSPFPIDLNNSSLFSTSWMIALRTNGKSSPS